MTLDEYYEIPIKVGDIVYISVYSYKGSGTKKLARVVHSPIRTIAAKRIFTVVAMNEKGEENSHTIIRAPDQVWKIPPELLV